MVCSTINRENSEEAYIDMLKRQMMDGVIMGAHSLELDIYEQVNRPIVALDRYINDEIPIVRSDHIQEGTLAAKCLWESGSRNAVQVTGARMVSTPAHNRHDIFRSCFESYGGTVHTFEMGWNHFDLDYIVKVTEKIFNECPDADGIFATDMLVGSCVRYAREQGIKVPEQMKMVACDGTYLTQLNERPITAIVQPVETLAQVAADQIIQLIGGKVMIKSETVLDVTLRKGETT